MSMLDFGRSLRCLVRSRTSVATIAVAAIERISADRDADARNEVRAMASLAIVAELLHAVFKYGLVLVALLCVKV